MKQFIGCLIVVAFIASLTSLPDKAPVVAATPVGPAKSASAVKTPVLSSQAPTPAVVAPVDPLLALYPAVCAQYLPLVEQYDWPVKTAMAIMQAESGCNATPALNGPINFDGVSDYGLFQLHGMPITDPAANVAAAYNVKYAPRHSFGPWTTYTSGKYLNYLR